MADGKFPMQAPGTGGHASQPDGVNDAADHGAAGQGVAYPNPHTGHPGGRFDGGQSERDYFGPGSIDSTDVGTPDAD